MWTNLYGTADLFRFCAVNMLTSESPIFWGILLSVFLNTSSEILYAYREYVKLGFFEDLQYRCQYGYIFMQIYLNKTNLKWVQKLRYLNSPHKQIQSHQEKNCLISGLFWDLVVKMILPSWVYRLDPVGIYMLKVSNRNSRARCEICSKQNNANWLKPATLLKLTFHGCFSRFLNCANATKSRNASHMCVRQID